jgi:uncharacterized protein YcaQ
MLAAQGLTQRPALATKEDVRRAIRRMHLLQIDTISVVARSPYFVLWSRIGDYDPRWLDQLLVEGDVFEYWAHAACFLPIEDYGLYRTRMLGRGRWRGNGRVWLENHADIADRVLQHIHDHGAVRAAAFERTDGLKAGWWNWKDEKLALECLVDVGELMIARRDGFQRVYDLQERVLPGWDDEDVLPIEEVNRRFVLNTIEALGVCKPEWTAEYIRLSKPEARAALQTLVRQGDVRTVAVEGWTGPGYYHPSHEALIAAAADGAPPAARTTLLSPFDPMVSDRARALDLFGFDYRIECYTPAPQRKYGYFTLPVLHQNRLIGRLDPKAHRSDGVFEVKALHLEPGVVVDDELVEGLKTALRECAAWHKTPQVVVREGSVPGLAERLSDRPTLAD